MSARSQALVPLSTEQQAAWRAVAETEKRRHQGNTLAEYPYAGAFFRCLNGSRRISLSDLRFFMPSLTAEELHGNRLQWLYAIDVLIETQGEVCLLPLPGDAAERLFPSVRFRVRERSRHKSALVMQKYSRQQAREAKPTEPFTNTFGHQSDLEAPSEAASALTCRSAARTSGRRSNRFAGSPTPTGSIYSGKEASVSMIFCRSEGYRPSKIAKEFAYWMIPASSIGREAFVL